MKILTPLPVRQFSSIQIQCSDRAMSEMLALRDNDNADTIFNLIVESRTSHNWSHMFKHGAKLHPSDKPNHFHIYCYSWNGADGTKAVIELRLLESLRAAADHLRRLDPNINLKSYLR